MTGAVARLIDGGTRLHLQHGPIDLIIGADGDHEQAFAFAKQRFATVLSELVGELAALRSDIRKTIVPFQGETARIMAAAAAPFARHKVTPMICVAGSVAQTVLLAMTKASLTRAYVNNGGDIAVHLSQDQSFDIAIAAFDGQTIGHLKLEGPSDMRGIATSGRHGRSLSLGIADSVSVVAKTASQADAAATLIANAVDLPAHPAIVRQPAVSLAPDSDLGDRPVVTGVGALSSQDIAAALQRGYLCAQDMRRRSLISSAALFLRGSVRIAGADLAFCQTNPRSLSHA